MNSRSAAGAPAYLIAALGRHLGHGGKFDYQRQGNSISGFTQLRHFRNISNVNVGLLCQQAGLSLEETLSTAGKFARARSSNYKESEPHGLDPQTAEYIQRGYEIGESGLYGKPARPAR